MNENGQESLSDFEAARSRLRQRWELASVLNFFKVFEPVIETKLKISAEEVETALILPNKSLAQIHIALLKGIPPVSKTLKDPDAWVVALSKKLIMWWPWVAEGDFPLTAAKGAEMSTYKELDPTIRLVLLKALCEIRADQYDVVEYVNDGVRNKNEMSTFRKNNIGEDGKGTLYWHDGNEILGFRLYKEVNTFKKNETTVSCQWETLATNLEEFQKLVDEYTSSGSKIEVAVSSVVETEVIPVLNKLQKKKRRTLQKKMDEERIMNNFCRTGITRSCRSSRPINYTFDEYDKAISEAIRETKLKKIKPKEKKREEKKVTVVKVEDSESTESESESESESSKHESKEASEDGSEESESSKNESKEVSENGSEESESSKHESKEVSEDGSEESGEEEKSDESDNDENNENESMSEDEDEDEDEMVLNSETENGKTKGSKKDSGGDGFEEMNRDFGAKKRLRQRPNRNTAIVADSEDEVSSENSDS